MTRIVNEIKSAQRIALFTHVSADGDAIGSTLGLAVTLLAMGKKVSVFLQEPIVKRLEFLSEISGVAYILPNEWDGSEVFDIHICLDCGDLGRLGEAKDFYLSGKIKINIDHHISNVGFGDINHVVSKASSTGELMFELIDALGCGWSKEAASMVYAAIASDTGCFVFANTNVSAHQFAGELMKYGADIAVINKLLFNTNEMQYLKLRAFAINTIELFKKGKIAVVTIDAGTLSMLGLTEEEAEGVSDLPRSIRGVEVGVSIREYKGKAKVSLRSNSWLDVSAIAAKFGGGGHKRAAGCVLDKNMEDAKAQIIEELGKAVEKFDGNS